MELPRPQTQKLPTRDLVRLRSVRRQKSATKITIENAHVPISVSVGDTLQREPTHICEKDPADLVRKFMEELERRGGGDIRAKVRATFIPDDMRMLPKEQRRKIEEWCDQVPVLMFNSGRYDLNLIREYFAERLSDTKSEWRKTETRSCSS